MRKTLDDVNILRYFLLYKFFLFISSFSRSSILENDFSCFILISSILFYPERDMKLV